MTAFTLDPRLQGDSRLVAEGPLSQLRLIDDARFHWLVLVPRLVGASELLDLDAGQQALLLEEINQACRLLRASAPCDKLNIGMLGNIVRQFHVHVLARVSGDAAWPGPVWGAGAMQPFATEALAARMGALRSQLPAGFWSPATD
jgi:diadenosine tetraphosphate (Ap4A) HIT family hydrolase